VLSVLKCENRNAPEFGNPLGHLLDPTGFKRRSLILLALFPGFSSLRNAGVRCSSHLSGTTTLFATDPQGLKNTRQSAKNESGLIGAVPGRSTAIAPYWGYGWGYSGKSVWTIPPNPVAGICGATAMALTNTAIQAAKPKAKPYKLTDEKGLFLLINPNGSRLWRLKFRVDGADAAGKPRRVEKLLALGGYPEVSLKAARDKWDEAREHHASGIDPSEQKKREKVASRLGAVNTFASIAEKVIEKNEREGLAEATLTKRRWFLKLLRPAIGKRPITEIQPIDILNALRPIEAKGQLETAKRTLNFVGQVFRYAVACQYVASDPTRDLRGALTAPKPKHLAAILEPEKVGGLCAAYARGAFWNERVEMAQWWSDYLDRLRQGGDVIPLIRRTQV